jgi:CBS-domain-containing membrane protein
MHGGERLRSVVHRVAIFNKDGAITDIVSQSDVIRCAHLAAI